MAAIPRGILPRTPVTTGGLPFGALPGWVRDPQTYNQSVGGATLTPAGSLSRSVAFTCSVGGGTVTPVGGLITNLIFRQTVGEGTVTPTGALSAVKGLAALAHVLLRLSGKLRGLWNRDVD